MKNIYVQFSDSNETQIVAIFGNPQPASFYPDQGTVENSDLRYVAFYDSLPDTEKHDWPVPDRAIAI